MINFDLETFIPILVLAAPVLLVSYKVYTAVKAKRAQPVVPKRFGRGAIGFETGSRKVELPLHIVARIKMGEEVTGEEITAALEQIRQDREDAETEERERLAEIEKKRIKAENKAKPQIRKKRK